MSRCRSGSRPRGRLVAASALLEARVTEGDDAAGAAYGDTGRALAAAAECVQPGTTGELLTTAQMAEW